jgi:hypothetical protein
VQNVEASLVWKILCRFVRFHAQNLAAEVAEVAKKSRFNLEPRNPRRLVIRKVPGFVVSRFLYSSPSK